VAERDWTWSGSRPSLNGRRDLTGVPALHDYDTAVAFRDDVDREIDLIGGAGPEHEECAARLVQNVRRFAGPQNVGVQPLTG